MIATTLENLGRYKGLGANLDKAIAWLEAKGWENLPVGRKDIDGEKVYALIQSYDTKNSVKAGYETHRAYLDIQFLVSGKEIIEVRDAKGLKVSVPYTPDIEFYATPEHNPCFAMFMKPGNILILFPEDAHRPCIAVGGVSEPARKIVLKIAL
ncbi:MAG: YhcH/YjgK/YiaL family protein [Spirochaetes bacterium]|nr:YhcH/YjgK/YiaL family protein [Spirochaetota bacterium]